jgi:hypothetical protein
MTIPQIAYRRTACSLLANHGGTNDEVIEPPKRHDWHSSGRDCNPRRGTCELPALIKAHRAAYRAFCNAIDRLNKIEDDPKPTEATNRPKRTASGRRRLSIDRTKKCIVHGQRDKKIELALNFSARKV